MMDAWNIAHDAGRPKPELVAGFDDFGNSLHGATPNSVADEVVARGSQWDLVAIAPQLAAIPVLTITARYGNAADERATTAALRRAGNRRVTAVELNSDHSFADHRIALAQTVGAWLKSPKR
jgi:hypothetical protein